MRAPCVGGAVVDGKPAGRPELLFSWPRGDSDDDVATGHARLREGQRAPRASAAILVRRAIARWQRRNSQPSGGSGELGSRSSAAQRHGEAPGAPPSGGGGDGDGAPSGLGGGSDGLPLPQPRWDLNNTDDSEEDSEEEEEEEEEEAPAPPPAQPPAPLPAPPSQPPSNATGRASATPSDGSPLRFVEFFCGEAPLAVQARESHHFRCGTAASCLCCLPCLTLVLDPQRIRDPWALPTDSLLYPSCLHPLSPSPQHLVPRQQARERVAQSPRAQRRPRGLRRRALALGSLRRGARGRAAGHGLPQLPP